MTNKIPRIRETFLHLKMPDFSAAILLLFIFTPLFAFNHPEIKWKSVTTKHFHIYFYDKTEPFVYAAWKIAEEAYTVFDSLYHYDSSNKIHLAIADYDDYSNGYAAWLQRTIMIWVTDARFDLRSNTTWLRNVITHELAHIMSLEKKKGMQLFDWTFALQYMSPNLNVTYGEPVAFTTFFPQWFAEGTAQLRAEQMGSDCWDSRRNMVLRCASLDNKILTLDEMGNFTHNSIGNEMVYNQGYSFTKYLESQLGKSKVARIWNDNRDRKFFGTGMKRYLRNNFNVSLDEMYKKWKESVHNDAELKKPSEPTNVDPVWEKGLYNFMPKISPDGLYWGWLTSHKDDYSRTDLIIANYGENIPIKRIKYAKTGWDFSSDGNTVYYIKSRKPNKNGSYLNDIFSYNLKDQKENKLTRSARIYDIAVSSDGDHLVCVQFKESVFSLILFSLNENKFKTIIKGDIGEPFLNASFMKKESGKIVVSKIVQGKAGLFLVDINNGKINPLANTEAQEESPFWAEDGRIYYSADYDGIFNIYSLLPDGSDMKRHTNVTGGAFSPIFDRNGKLLISEYVTDGFRIGECPVEDIPYEIPNTPVCLFKQLPVPKGRVKIIAHDYKAKTLRPTWEIFTGLICTDMDKAFQDMIMEGKAQDSLWNIYLDFETDIFMSRYDVVGRKEMYLGGAVLINAGWDSGEDSTDTNDSISFINSLQYNINNIKHNARPSFLRKRDQKKYGMTSNTLKNYIKIASMTSADSEDDSDSENESSVNMPLLVPFYGIESRVYKQTFGLDAQAYLVMMIPALINLNPYIESHVLRDLYIGLSPDIILDITALLSPNNQLSLSRLTSPLWIQWIHEGYINEDVYYNMAGVSILSVYAGPDIFQYIKIEENLDIDSSVLSSDTTAETVSSFMFGIQFMHAIPILKYLSLSLSTDNNCIKAGDEISYFYNYKDSIISDFFLFSDNKASFSFPIIRNINRGRLYLDNLYGNIFYRVNFYGSGEFLSNPNIDTFRKKDYHSEYASLYHYIGMGIELGSVKNYMFQRTLKLSSEWDIFNKEFNVDLSMWF